MSKHKPGYLDPTQSERTLAKAGRKPENLKEQGKAANIRQNTTNQGYPKGDK